MQPCIIVFNAGSSSIKFSLFSEEQALLFRGEIDSVTQDPKLWVKDIHGHKIHEATGLAKGHISATEAILDWVNSRAHELKITLAGHRVVHGGREFSTPVAITDDLIEKLKALIPLAPLHQPHNISTIEAFTKLYPDIPQVACFDTAFHRSQPKISQEFALPRKYTDEGIIRYGFHGISYQYIASVLPQYLSKHERVVVAHLGNGASMCAMRNLQSVATTMGFTALDGLMMGTRCGNIDPGVILYLLQAKGMSTDAVTDLLYKESGLKGVSGISSDMRDLIKSDDAYAKEAVELFCYQAAKELASLLPALGGLDAIVFTAGIGENCAVIRQMICGKLEWLGVEVDNSANEKNSIEISSQKSKIKVFVIPTNEEKIIAQSSFM
jgi:acetate kinase